MKIAIIGADHKDSMEFHFMDAFINACHEVEIFDIYNSFLYTQKCLKSYFQSLDKIRRTYSDNYDQKRFLALARKVNRFDPDLVICFYKDIHPVFVDNVKKAHRKVIHVNPDAMTTLGYQQIFASNYDAWFSKDPYMTSCMKRNMHLNVFLYREAFNQRYNPKPDVGKKEMEKNVNIDVMTYGTLYPYRTQMLKILIDAGVDIKLYGVIPHRFFNESVAKYCTGKYIVGEEKARILYGSKIVFNNFHYAEIESVNCRFFEANGCGAFQLCDYRPVLHELLPIDPELVSFRTIDEGIDKIKYYLSHDEERWEISAKIYEYFINHYTYDHLIQYILNVVNKL